MYRVLAVFAGMAWLTLTFFLTLWLTFPSDAVIERVRYEVDRNTKGSLAIDIDSVGPWWTGLSASGVTLSAVQGAGTDAAEASPLLEAEWSRRGSGSSPPSCSVPT